MHRTMGFAHALAFHHLDRARRRAAPDDGQGTVEYIGLILLLGMVMAVVATKGNGGTIGGKVVSAIQDSIDSVTSLKR